MSRPLAIAVGALLGVAVFQLVFWLTFPSTAMAGRVEHEVRERTGGEYLVEMDGVSPWWVGLSAQRLIASKADPRDPSSPPVPFFFGDVVAAKVAPLSLLQRRPAVTGHVAFDEGSLDVDLRAVVEEGQWRARGFSIDGDAVPVPELLGLLSMGAPSGIVADGGLDIEADLRMGQGLERADGDVSIQADGLRIDTLTVPALGWVDKELATTVDELDLRLRFDGGEGEVVRGMLRSTLLDVEIQGTVTLGNRVDRTKLDLELVVELADWTGTALETYRSVVDSLLRSAAWGDGTHHYEIDTTLDRFSGSSIRPVPERGSSTSTPSLPSRVPTLPTRQPITPPPTLPPPTLPTQDADRGDDLFEDDEDLFEDDEDLFDDDEEIFDDEEDLELLFEADEELPR